jgi:hypothetical protein
MEYLTPKAPEKCLFCDSPYMGGHVKPGEHMEMGLRVFYHCGASISIFKGCSHPENGAFHLLVKNCHCEHNMKVLDSEVVEVG